MKQSDLFLFHSAHFLTLLIEPGDPGKNWFCSSFFFFFLLRLLDQIYFVTQSLPDEMMNFVNSSLFQLLAIFLIIQNATYIHSVKYSMQLFVIQSWHIAYPGSLIIFERERQRQREREGGEREGGERGGRKYYMCERKTER